MIKKKQNKRINNADLFSQTCLIIFTKDANIFGHDCMCVYMYIYIYIYIYIYTGAGHIIRISSTS